MFQQLEEMQRILGTHEFLDTNLEQNMASNTEFVANTRIRSWFSCATGSHERII